MLKVKYVTEVSESTAMSFMDSLGLFFSFCRYFALQKAAKLNILTFQLLLFYCRAAPNGTPTISSGSKFEIFKK